MSELNPDHIKYMPPASSSEASEPAEEHSSIAEELTPEEVKVEIKEEVVVVVKEEEQPSEADSYVTRVEVPHWYEFGPVKALYALLSPMLAPTIATWWIFSLSLLKLVVPGAAFPYSVTVFGATCIVPMMVAFVVMRVRGIKSFQFYGRRQRLALYVVEFVAFAALTLFFINRGANAWIWTVFCGAAAVTLANFIINLFYRVSNHCSAMAALLAVLLVINVNSLPTAPLLWWVVGTVAAIGFVGVMAMTLGRHTFWEVFLGYTTGFLGIILMSLIS